jgi:hypothetical protein
VLAVLNVIAEERDLAEAVAGAEPPYRRLALPREELPHFHFSVLDDVEPVAVIAFLEDGLPRLEVLAPD